MLDKYKKGELSEEQMEQVEADLMRQMFRKQKEAELRNNLKNLAADIKEDEYTDGTSRYSREGGVIETQSAKSGLTVVHRSNRSWTWLAAAASVALLAVASWWLFLKPTLVEPLSTAALADTYLKNDATPIWGTTMGNTSVEEREAKAKEAYDAKDFDKAVGLFQALPPTKKEHYFYLGIATLKQPKPDATKAIDNLLKARTLANGWEEDATNWYLALAYIKSGKATEARNELNNIIKIGRDNVNRAEELLKKMPAAQ